MNFTFADVNSAALVFFGIVALYCLTLITNRDQGPLERKIVLWTFCPPFFFFFLYYIGVIGSLIEYFGK